MLKSPYPYFGGKRLAAHLIWDALGDVTNYVEPFLGSAAVLLARPEEHGRKVETVNDKDGFISNFWRAVQADASAVARFADWPVNENDLHARHAWLVGQRENMTARLEGDPAWFDARVAGWWVWGMACWIGHGFCSGDGPWQVENGQLVHLGNNGQGVTRRLVHVGDSGQGVQRKLVHVGNNGQGVQRKLVHVGNSGRGVTRQLVHVGNSGQGVTRQLVHVGNSGRGVHSGTGENGLEAWFDALQERLKRVRVCSGDWTRVMGTSVTTKHGLTGVVLDPPYVTDSREAVYTHDSHTIAGEVREWAIANGDNPLLRIVYCGYEDGYQWPTNWRSVEWKASKGYQSHKNRNRERERLWLSPGCLGAGAGASTMDMFELYEVG